MRFHQFQGILKPPHNKGADDPLRLLNFDMGKQRVVFGKTEFGLLETVAVHVAASMHFPHDDAGGCIFHGFLKHFREYQFCLES